MRLQTREKIQAMLGEVVKDLPPEEKVFVLESVEAQATIQKIISSESKLPRVKIAELQIKVMDYLADISKLIPEELKHLGYK
jgi:hypothetical protein